MTLRRSGSGIPPVGGERTPQPPIALADRLVDVATELFRQAVGAHKAELRGRFALLARDAGLSDPDCVAAELLLLLE